MDDYNEHQTYIIKHIFVHFFLSSNSKSLGDVLKVLKHLLTEMLNILILNAGLNATEFSAPDHFVSTKNQYYEEVSLSVHNYTE